MAESEPGVETAFEVMFWMCYLAAQLAGLLVLMTLELVRAVYRRIR